MVATWVGRSSHANCSQSATALLVSCHRAHRGNCKQAMHRCWRCTAMCTASREGSWHVVRLELLCGAIAGM